MFSAYSTVKPKDSDLFKKGRNTLKNVNKGLFSHIEMGKKPNKSKILYLSILVVIWDLITENEVESEGKIIIWSCVGIGMENIDVVEEKKDNGNRFKLGKDDWLFCEDICNESEFQKSQKFLKAFSPMK